MLTLTDVSTPEGPSEQRRNSQAVMAEHALKEGGRIHLVRPASRQGVVADSIISPFVCNQSCHLAPLLPSLNFPPSNSPLALKPLLSCPAGFLTCEKIADKKKQVHPAYFTWVDLLVGSVPQVHKTFPDCQLFIFATSLAHYVLEV